MGSRFSRGLRRLWREGEDAEDGEPRGGYGAALQRAAVAAAVALGLVALDALTGALSSLPRGPMGELLVLAGAVTVLVLGLRRQIQQRITSGMEADEVGLGATLPTSSSMVEPPLRILRQLCDATRGTMALTCAILSSSPPGATDPAPEFQALFLADLKRYLVAFVAIAVEGFGLDSDDLEAAAAPPADIATLLLDAEFAQLIAAASASSGNLAARGRLCTALIELWLRRCVHRGVRHGLVEPREATELQDRLNALPPLHMALNEAWKAQRSRRSPMEGSGLQHEPLALALESLCRRPKLVVLGFLEFYALVQTGSHGIRTPLWVLLWGIVLFSIEALVSDDDCRMSSDGGGVGSGDVLAIGDRELLHLQDELSILTCNHAATVGIREGFDSHDRSLPRWRRIDHRRRQREQRGIRAQDRPPTTSRSQGEDDGLGKSTSSTSTSFATRAGTSTSLQARRDELRPLLPVSFLRAHPSRRRASGSASDATDDEDDDEQNYGSLTQV